MRLADMGGWLALTVGLCLAPTAPAGADANGVFADDLESGTLLTSEVPAGHWDSFFTLGPDISMNASAAAAKRGPSAFG